VLRLNNIIRNAINAHNARQRFGQPTMSDVRVINKQEAQLLHTAHAMMHVVESFTSFNT